jgi:hypothetical protein
MTGRQTVAALVTAVLLAVYPAAVLVADGKEYVIEDVQFSLAPSKPVFEHDEPAVLVVRLHNRSSEKRFLRVSVPRDHERGQKKTVVLIADKQIEAQGIPCYLHVNHFPSFSSFDMRICAAGYSDEYRGQPVPLEPGARASFRIVIPASVESPGKRPTGYFTIFSRFAVSRAPKGKATLANGPETSLLVINHEELTRAVKTLTAALAGDARERDAIEKVVRIIAENPLPEHAGLIARAIQHEWGFRRGIDWTLWLAAEQFVSREIYDVAVAEAKKPDARRAGRAYPVIFRNRVHLQRKDVLSILNNPLLEDAGFRGKNLNSFYPVLLLALVAEPADMPRLASMLPRIRSRAHDWGHPTIRDRKYGLIDKAFLQYPDAAMPPLRKLLEKGLKDVASTGRTRLVPPRGSLDAVRLLVQMQDEKATDLILAYATIYADFTSDFAKIATRHFFELDTPAAMRALQNLPRWYGIGERAERGDPSALDIMFERARRDALSTCGTGVAEHKKRLVSLLQKYGCPKDSNVDLWWQQHRPELVVAFKKKYGFVPASEKSRVPRWDSGLSPLPDLSGYDLSVSLKVAGGEEQPRKAGGMPVTVTVSNTGKKPVRILNSIDVMRVTDLDLIADTNDWGLFLVDPRGDRPPPIRVSLVARGVHGRKDFAIREWPENDSSSKSFLLLKPSEVCEATYDMAQDLDYRSQKLDFHLWANANGRLSEPARIRLDKTEGAEPQAMREREARDSDKEERALSVQFQKIPKK